MGGMGQRARRQVQTVLAQTFNDFIAQMHARKGICREAMRFHPVAHVPAAHSARL